MDHFVLDPRTRTERRGFRYFNDSIKDFCHDDWVTVSHVVKHLGELRYHVRGITPFGNNVVNARILRHVLSHKISHEVHRLESIERRATPIRRAGRVRCRTVKSKLRTFI